MFQTLSGRFFILTVLFVILAEVLILVPSVARFRLDYLSASLERAQIASLALEAEERISSDLEAELLATAEVYNVVLRRNEVRQLVLSSPIPAPVVASFNLRHPSFYELVFDGLAALFDSSDHVIRVIGDPVRRAGLLIEIAMSTRGLHEALVTYASQVLWVSTAISALTAVLLFWAVRQALLLPMRHVVSHMKSYANAPEDARSIIAPDARLSELLEAQEAMKSMQIELTGALKQKERLAQLGGAVAKISHDLRNCLPIALKPAKTRRLHDWRQNWFARFLGPSTCAKRHWPLGAPRRRRLSSSGFTCRACLRMWWRQSNWPVKTRSYSPTLWLKICSCGPILSSSIG